MAKNNHFPNSGSIWEKHRPYIEQLSGMTNSYIFVSERRGPYLFLSPNMKNMGYDIPPEGWSPDNNFLEHRIHPDDLAVFVDLLTKLYDYYVPGLPEEEQMNYKYIFEFRGLNKNGEWVRVITQMQILDFNSLGDPIQLGAIDLSPDQTPGTGVRFTLMNFKTGEIVPFAIRDGEGESLTKREVEILRLIDEGMYSKAISERLSISIHTVNRHRQNILEKMNASNAREAINYARKLGLLS